MFLIFLFLTTRSCDLLMETFLTSEQRNFVKVINKSSSMLLNLISNILDFSRIEAGKLELDNARFNFEDCLHNIIATMNIANKKKAKETIEIKLEASTHLPEHVIGDEMRFTQVLVNLLGNAIKFSNNEGTVTVRVDTVHNDEGNDNHSDDIDMRIDVIDHGIGIPQNRQQALFKRFVQVDSSSAKLYGGAGLGLAICKTLVQKMGGRIWIDKSEPGKGSTFSFTCRFKKFSDNIAPREVVDHTLDDSFDFSNTRILIAEDNNINRRVMSAMLDGIGAPHYTLTADGQEAFDTFQQDKYDIVLMDLNMPRVDGIAATKMIRQYEENHGKKHCIVIAVTANASELQRDECMNAGMTTFVTKPIRKQTLRRVMAKSLRER